ncbi:MAG: hypothetical protein U9Q69_02190 [Nanoarchaeota archaeon]|nr:hypothetical protein [Nanoarchaeota archaeon]
MTKIIISTLYEKDPRPVAATKSDYTKEAITEEGLNNSSVWIIPPNSLLLSMYATIGENVINKIPLKMRENTKCQKKFLQS